MGHATVLDRGRVTKISHDDSTRRKIVQPRFVRTCRPFQTCGCARHKVASPNRCLSERGQRRDDARSHGGREPIRGDGRDVPASGAFRSSFRRARGASRRDGLGHGRAKPRARTLVQRGRSAETAGGGPMRCRRTSERTDGARSSAPGATTCIAAIAGISATRLDAHDLLDETLLRADPVDRFPAKSRQGTPVAPHHDWDREDPIAFRSAASRAPLHIVATSGSIASELRQRVKPITPMPAATSTMPASSRGVTRSLNSRRETT